MPGAKNVTIVRGKNRGESCLKIIDDGQGIPDFRLVATHIGDSAKRELKKKGAQGLRGESGPPPLLLDGRRHLHDHLDGERRNREEHEAREGQPELRHP